MLYISYRTNFVRTDLSITGITGQPHHIFIYHLTSFFTMELKIKRIQSASSINTFKQCPRKYFYSYVLELPTAPNIYQVRGNIAHSALEHFFTINTNHIDEKNYEKQLKNSTLRKNIKKICNWLTFIFLLLSFIFCINNAG